MPKDDNCDAKSTFKPSSELQDSTYKGGEIWKVTFVKNVTFCLKFSSVLSAKLMKIQSSRLNCNSFCTFQLPHIIKVN